MLPKLAMGSWLEPVRELTKIFRASSSKHEAHSRSRQLLEQLSRDPTFLTSVLEKHLGTPGTLEARNYPVVALPIASTPYFDLVVNCWIPLPNNDTNLSTKTIHHHGTLLLSTATLFGPGYEHWMFTTPRHLDRNRELYVLELVEAAPHARHHVAFVDKNVAHCPFYPASLTLTLALWSNSLPTTWRDRVKRIPLFKRHSRQLRDVAVRLGMKNALDLKVLEYFDFFPTPDGFKGMRDRQEFRLGPNEDHLQSLFHVIQKTGNSHLVSLIRRQRKSVASPMSQKTVDRLVLDLSQDRQISGRLSAGHYDVPFANFTKTDIGLALRTIDTKESYGRRLIASQGAEAHLGTRSQRA